MRILRLITRLNIGGPSQQAILLGTILHQPPAIETLLVTGQPDSSEGNLTDLARQRGAQVMVVPQLRRPLHPVRDLLAWWTLLRIAWRFQPDLIHTHMAKAGLLGRVTGFLYNAIGPGRRRGRRVTLVHTFHGHVLEGYFSPWVTRVFVIIERWLARRTDRLIAVSPAIQSDLLDLRIGAPAQWRVIPVGLSLSALAHMPMPNGSTALRIGMVGRLVPIKNPALFLDALAQVLRDRSGVERSGWIVGDGPLRRDLEQRARQLGVHDRVRFTGWQQELAAVYGGLEIVCLTSWNEGTPVAVIEAMAAGRAVVATDVGGVRDVLCGGEDEEAVIPAGGFVMAQRGLVVRPGDAAGLAQALRRLADDAGLRQTLGQRARAYAVPTFSGERLVRDIRALYEEIQAKDSTCMC